MPFSGDMPVPSVPRNRGQSVPDFRVPKSGTREPGGSARAGRAAAVDRSRTQASEQFNNRDVYIMNPSGTCARIPVPTLPLPTLMGGQAVLKIMNFQF